MFSVGSTCSMLPFLSSFFIPSFGCFGFFSIELFPLLVWRLFIFVFGPALNILRIKLCVCVCICIYESVFLLHTSLIACADLIKTKSFGVR